MTFIPRKEGEALAMHLHHNAVALGCTTGQIATLREAARLSMGNRDQRVRAGQLAAPIRDQLKEALAAAVFAAQARGEKVVDFNDDGAKRVKGRDGLKSMLDSEAITEAQFNTGLVYRGLFEAVDAGSVGSQLGRLGEASAGRTSTDAMVRHGLHGAYASVRLTEAEKAVGCPDRVALLRAVAGHGQTIGSLTSSGHRRKVMAEGLAAALDAVRPELAKGLQGALDAVALSLARTGGLRITGS